MLIEIDEALVNEAMRLTGAGSPTAVIEQALRTTVRLARQAQLLELRGALDWDGDLDDMRRD